jgi:antitoxin VapB
MSIFIKNPEVERKARELAKLKGQSLTQVIGEALERPLAEARFREPKRRPTLDEIRAATVKFRRVSGLDQRAHEPFTKKDWDVLWPTGVAEIDKA